MTGRGFAGLTPARLGLGRGSLAALLVVCFIWVGHSGGLFATQSNARRPAGVAEAAALAVSGVAPFLHGFQSKAGPVPYAHHHSTLFHERKANYTQWVEQQDERGTKGRLPPVVFPGCAVWVNDAYKVIFIRHPKCGTTSVLSQLAMCGAEHANASAQPSFCMLPWGNTLPTSRSRNMSAADVERVWREYFVFTVVRNPLSRAASSYKHILKTNCLAAPECQQMTDRVDWNSFCADPLLPAKMCGRLPKQCCTFGDVWSAGHVVDQARCMTTQGGRLAVDYVARMEHLDQDMVQVVAEINRRRPQGLPPIPLPASFDRVNTAPACTQMEAEAQHGSVYPTVEQGQVMNHSSILAKESAYCDTRQFYEGRHAHCLHSIARAYRQDLVLLYMM